jgi:hypothetical protein
MVRVEQAKNEILANPPRLFSDMGDYFQNVIYFTNKVRSLPSYHPNFPYKDKVIGQDGNIQQEAKEGIITRFVNQLKMERERRGEEQKKLLKQQEKLKSLSTGNNNGHQPSLPAEVITSDEW